jgi:hypothetical protein
MLKKQVQKKTIHEKEPLKEPTSTIRIFHFSSPVIKGLSNNQIEYYHKLHDLAQVKCNLALTRGIGT